MSTAPVISAQNLSLTFETNDGPVHALKDVSLDIEKGDFVSFIGPSGCGKTTFLRCMADLEQPTGGESTAGAGLWLCVSGGGALSLADDWRQYPAAA